MKFRPCIDIHNGKVKQIVGGSLRDAGDLAKENFVSEQDAAFYARLYRDAGLTGGHVILLNPESSPEFPATKQQALLALAAYPGGLQLGGGVNPQNAEGYLDAGASHVIVTSYVFRDGRISWENLEKMEKAVGREHLVLDLSCRRKNGCGDEKQKTLLTGSESRAFLVDLSGESEQAPSPSDKSYYVVTDRWQKFTGVPVTLELMETLGEHCSEFLVHAVDVEGKARGIETELAELLGQFRKCPVTYAGGVGDLEDIDVLRIAGGGRLDVTVGSALDIFGGNIPFAELAGMNGQNDGF